MRPILTRETPPSLELTLSTTAPRDTPPSAGRRFRDALDGAAGLLFAGVERAGGILAGPSVAALAVTGVGRGSLVADDAAGGGQSTQAALDDAFTKNREFLELQSKVNEESQLFSTLSNVMKARHDTAKATINNIR